MTRKLKPRSMDRSALLSPAERQAQRKRQIKCSRTLFEAWFQFIPGAEWEYRLDDESLVFCRWWMNPERTEWGKVFYAYRLDSPLEWLQDAVARIDPSYLPQDAHWSVLGIDESTATVESVQDATQRAYLRPHITERERGIIAAAYGRALNELWHRENSDGRKK